MFIIKTMSIHFKMKGNIFIINTESKLSRKAFGVSTNINKQRYDYLKVPHTRRRKRDVI